MQIRIPASRDVQAPATLVLKPPEDRRILHAVAQYHGCSSRTESAEVVVLQRSRVEPRLADTDFLVPAARVNPVRLNSGRFIIPECRTTPGG